MNASNKSPRPLHRCNFSVEPLEDRFLLSATTVQPEWPGGAFMAAVTPEQAEIGHNRIQLLEFSVANDEGDDDTQELSVAQLPEAVRSTVLDRFPGATLLSAEIDDEDAFLFNIAANWNDAELEITFSADGNVLEVEELLAPGALPELLRDWIAGNLPGASIREAERVTAQGTLHYDLLLATPTDQLFEATLRLSDASGPRNEDAAGRLVDDPLRFLLAGPVAGASLQQTDPLHQTPTAAGTQAAQTTTVADAPISQQAALQTRVPFAPNPGRPPATADSLNVASSTVALVAQRLAGTNDHPAPPLSLLAPAVSETAHVVAPALPQLAQAVADLLPPSLQAIEEGLNELLGAIDALATGIDTNAYLSGLTPRLLIGAVVLVGTHGVINDMRRAKRGHSFPGDADDSTWTYGRSLLDTWSH